MNTYSPRHAAPRKPRSLAGAAASLALVVVIVAALFAPASAQAATRVASVSTWSAPVSSTYSRTTATTPRVVGATSWRGPANRGWSRTTLGARHAARAFGAR